MRKFRRCTAALLALLLCLSVAACKAADAAAVIPEDGSAPVSPADDANTTPEYPTPVLTAAFAQDGSISLTWEGADTLYYELAYVDEFTGRRHVLAVTEPGTALSWNDSADASDFSRIYTVTAFESLSAKAEGVATCPTAELSVRSGFVNTDGYLYYYVNNVPAANAEINGISFDRNGLYSCGDEELDAMIAELICEYTTPDMAPVERFRALYLHIMDRAFFDYGAEPFVLLGTEDWEPAYAKKFLQTGFGNCFSYAALTTLCARALGLEAYTVIGDCHQGLNWVWHCWVNVIQDGEVYICDAEMEGVFAPEHDAQWDLFMIPEEDTPIVYAPQTAE